MFRNLFKPTIAAAALAVAACGGTEEKPIRDTNLRELGSFEIEFRPDGTSTIRSGVYNQLVFASDGSTLTNPPGTIQAVTTSAVIGTGENGCALGLNCFVVEVTNFTGQPQGGVFMGIDQISGGGGRVLQSSDPVPAGVTALTGTGRNFGNLAPGGSATENMDFSIPNNSSYLVRGRYWGDDGSVTKSITFSPAIEVRNTAQYGVALAPVAFTADEFPPSARVQDVNVQVIWDKTAGTCASQFAGNARHEETSFRLYSPGSVKADLARTTPLPSSFFGTPEIEPVTVTFDSDASSGTNQTQPPVSGTFQARQNLDTTYLNLLPAGNWHVRAGAGAPGGAQTSLCVLGYSISIIAN